jgi:hypothetical protein
MRRLFLIITFLSATLAWAEAPPTAEQFLGYPVGSRLTPPHLIVSYFERLAASPRVKIVRYGTSWEGRPLLYAVITSEENQARLADIEAGQRKLFDVESTSRAEAERIAAASPVVVWLANGVHGDESSPPEAALLVAERLALDPAAAPLLREAVIILDPLQNPDGRERFVQSLTQRLGRRPNVDPGAIEHHDPWPSGRDNHYFVDLNRDWMWSSQPETKARVEAYRRWNPHVFVDLHEMTYSASYFFPPDADPINSNIAAATEGWLERFGRANSAAFSERSWPFFVGESFDLFYPGYGDSWPSLRGAIGMTYEAGGKGAALAVRRDDESILTLRERVDRHYVSSMTTIETSVRNRRDLILHSYDVLRKGVESGSITYVIDAPSGLTEPLLRVFDRQGIRYRALRGPVKLKATAVRDGRTSNRDFRAGSIVVSTRQPLGMVVQALMERSPELPKEYINEQRAKVEADEPDDFYDITTWSVPLAMNLPTWTVSSVPETVEVVRPTTDGGGLLPAAKFGYLLSPTEPDFYRVLGRLLQREVRFSVSSTPLGQNQSLPRGTVLIEKHRNPKELEPRLREALEGTAARLRAVDEIWSEGPALGSSRINYVKPPRVALLFTPGVEQTSFGALWHTLDVETEIPHSVISADVLKRQLSEYDVLLIPDGSLDLASLGKPALARLRNWVEGGGTLIAIRRTAESLRSKDVALSSLKNAGETESEEGEPAKKEPTPRESIPGAAFRTTMNERSYLTFGIEESPAVLLRGVTPLATSEQRSANIVAVAERDVLASGFAWPEGIERTRGGIFLGYEKLGSGALITFADEPYYRNFWRSTMPLLMNAVVYSPTFAGK